MKTIPAVLAVVLVLGTGLSRLAAQVAMEEDPYHTRLLYALHLRMYDVNIPPGATSLEHAHDRDLATVAISDGAVRRRQPGQGWSEPSARTTGSVQITSYTGAPAVHQVETVGASPYRLFAFENLRESGWTTPELVAAPGTTLVEESRAFAVYEVRLDASTPETSHTHQMPSVVTLLSGAIDVQGGGGETPFSLTEPGRWFPSTWEAPHTLMLAAGSGEARIMCVEAR